MTNQHKQRLAADESYLAASLKVPPPKKKIVRSEDASQRGVLASEISTIFSIFRFFCFCVTGGRKVRLSALLG